MGEIGEAVARISDVSSSLTLEGESDSVLEDPELEKELAKLLEDDGDEDYINEKLSGLKVHDSSLDSDDNVRESIAKKDRISA